MDGKKSWMRWLIWGTAASVWGLLIAGWAYQTAVAGEKTIFQVGLTAKEEKPVELDLAQQGWTKKFLQPGRVNISSGPGGIVNRSDRPLRIQVELVGIPGAVSLSSSDVAFDGKTGVLQRDLQPGEAFDLDLAVDLPADRLNQHKVFKGALWFTDRTSGNVVGNLPIRVYNTAIPPSKEDLEDADCPMHAGQPAGENPHGAGKH